MALRAFKVTMFVAIDADERDECQVNDGELTPEPNANNVKKFLQDALILDVDEEFGNPIGFQSAEIIYDTLAEMSPEEVKANYGKTS